MPNRPAELQDFLDAARAAFTAAAGDPKAQASLSKSFDALDRVGEPAKEAGQRLPVCARHLEAASAPERFEAPELRRLAEAFHVVEPSLVWVRHRGAAPGASANYVEEHANAMFVGPGGIERRTDVWIGVSLLAPEVRYPDHTHPPEETYLVMSAGQFRQEDGPWFEPGIGGSFYNPPGIAHAMRSGPEPLFAFWTLRDTATQ